MGACYWGEKSQIKQINYGPSSAIGTVSNCRYKDRELILSQSHSFVVIDQEIFSLVYSPPSADSRGVGVIYKPKYVHKVLVNCLVKLCP